MKDFLSDLEVGGVMPVEDVSDRPPLSIDVLQGHAKNLCEVEGTVPLAVYVYGSELALRVNCQFLNPDARMERLRQTLPSLARGADRILLHGNAELQHGEGVVVVESRPDLSTTYVAEVARDGSLGPWLPPDHAIKERFEGPIASAWRATPEKSRTVYVLERGVAIDVPGSGIEDAPRVTAEQLRVQAEKAIERGDEVRPRAYAYGPRMSVCLDLEDLDSTGRGAAIPIVLGNLVKKGAELFLLQEPGPLMDGFGVLVTESRPDGNVISAATVTPSGTLGPWGPPDSFANDNLSLVFRLVWSGSDRVKLPAADGEPSVPGRPEKEWAMAHLRPGFGVKNTTSLHDLGGRPPVTLGKLREHVRNLHEIEGCVPAAVYLYGNAVALRIEIGAAGQDYSSLSQAVQPLAALGAERILLVSRAAARNVDGVIVCESRREGTIICFAEAGDDSALGPWISADPESKSRLTRFFGRVWAQVPEPGN